MDESRAAEENQPSDLTQAKPNDTGTPEQLVDRYGGPVYRFCRSLTWSKEDAEDLFQETFLRTLEKPLTFQAAQNPQALLFSTVMFLWKSWKRKYARRSRLAPAGTLDETVPSGLDLEAGCLARDEAWQVRQLVNALPEKYKIPIILYYTLELDVAGIAETLGIPEGTVKSRLHKGRKLVARGLKE